MIGGAMLLCAVGAMLLIARWSMAQDDLPEGAAQTGLLALRKPRTPAAARHARAEAMREAEDAPPPRPPSKIMTAVQARVIEDEVLEKRAALENRKVRRRGRTVEEAPEPRGPVFRRAR